MEAPYPPDTVEPNPVSCQRSRSGPVFSAGEGVFQPALSGKYPRSESVSHTDDSSDFSSPLRPADNRQATIQFPVNRQREIVLDGETLVYYQNVRGLRTKIDEFYSAVADTFYDIIVLTETWLDDVIDSRMLFDNGFVVYRGDRSRLTSEKKRGGGVLIAVRSRVPSSVIPMGESGLEHIWVAVNLQHCKLIIGAVYIPPDKTSEEHLFNQHCACLESITASSRDSDKIAVFGDYNLRGIKWVRSDSKFCSIDVAASSLSRPCNALVDGMSFNNMEQINCAKNRNGNVLDLVFINNVIGDAFELDIAADPLVRIDEFHPPLLCTLKSCEPPVMFTDDVDTLGLNFKRARYHELGRYLSQVNWYSVTSCENLNESVARFTSIVQQACVLSVPLHRRPRKPPWSNAELRRSKINKNRASRAYRSSRCLRTKLTFKMASRHYRNLNQCLYRRYTSSIERDLKQNPKRFWSFVRSKKKESGLPSAMFLDHRTVNSSREKC